MFHIAAVLTIAALAVAFAPPPRVSAVEYPVAENPYRASHTIRLSLLWNAYELNAAAGLWISYSMNVTNTGGCASLLLVKGHDPTLDSVYYSDDSRESCASAYRNTFPVGPADGTSFRVLIWTEQTENVTYDVTIEVVTPPPPGLPSGVGVTLATRGGFAGRGFIGILIDRWRNRRRAGRAVPQVEATRAKPPERSQGRLPPE